MNRLEALQAAETMLDSVSPKVNGRGYPDGCLTGQARVTEVLRLAEFLLQGTGDEDVPAYVPEDDRIETHSTSGFRVVVEAMDGDREVYLALHDDQVYLRAEDATLLGRALYAAGTGAWAK